MLALVDGYGHIIERYTDYLTSMRKSGASISAHWLRICCQTYPDGEALREFIARHVAHIKAHHSGASSSPYILYWRLITASLALARATVDNTFAQEDSPTRQFVATALAKIAQNNRGDSVAYIETLRRIWFGRPSSGRGDGIWPFLVPMSFRSRRKK